MANAVIMPRQGQSVESCLVASVNKKKGDTVNIGDILFSYETDKSAFEEDAKLSGTVLEVFIQEGDDVPCLDTVMIIGREGEDISSLIPDKSSVNIAENSNTEDIPVTSEKQTDADIDINVNAGVAIGDGKFKISPRARNYADKAKVDLSKAVPTGPNGRIIERDIAELVNKGHRLYSSVNEEDKTSGASSEEINAVDKVNAVNSARTDTAAEVLVVATANIADIPEMSEIREYTDEKLSNVRKIIGKSMQQSLASMAQLTLNSSFDASDVLKFRKTLKDNAQVLGLENITLNDIILYAVAKTLKNHKNLNAHYLDDTMIMRYFSGVNLGVAVDTDRGLIVPTIFDADKMTLNELSKAAKDIIAQAQKGTVDPDNLKGGTFTVTNLGALGIESFTPVINPPQTGILGVNNITRRVKQVNGQDVFYDCMSLSLTFDHRALDGAPAARFLKELCVNLENFSLILAK